MRDVRGAWFAGPGQSSCDVSWRHTDWGVAWWVAVVICKPVLILVRRCDWRGVERIPARGPAVLAANHISKLDPLLVAEMVLAHGRIPGFLAKSSLFEEKIVGRWFRAAGHVEVDRSHGADGFGAALTALRSGALLVVYPEGTITKDPDGGLMGTQNRRCAAGNRIRSAAHSRCPTRRRRDPAGLQPPPETVQTAHRHHRIGPPLDLTDLRQLGPGPETAIAGTRRLADALAQMLDQLAERHGASDQSSRCRSCATSS